MVNEKRKPHYDLKQIKEKINKDRYYFTQRATRDFRNELGLVKQEALDVILNLSMSEFKKSMTSYSDKTLWQDVYNAQLNSERLYIKLQISHDDKSVIISFKRK